MKHENLNTEETANSDLGAVSTRFLSELSDIKPCPFCGNKMPFSYYNASTAYLGCDNCGINFGSAQVIYKRDELPQELKGLEYEADALEIVEEEFKKFSEVITEFPTINLMQNYLAEQEQLRDPFARKIEYYLSARQKLEKIFSPLPLRPNLWENYRPLWYTKFAKEPIYE